MSPMLKYNFNSKIIPFFSFILFLIKGLILSMFDKSLINSVAKLISEQYGPGQSILILLSCIQSNDPKNGKIKTCKFHVRSKIKTLLVLFEQSNCIDWIIFCIIVTEQNIEILVPDSFKRQGNSIICGHH